MPVDELDNVPREPFKGGATYQTVVGDQEGSTPVRVGIETSPPGYKTSRHSHPYMETVAVLEGRGEAWLDDGCGVMAGWATRVVTQTFTIGSGQREMGR